jgi:hypothetical protein
MLGLSEYRSSVLRRYNKLECLQPLEEVAGLLVTETRPAKLGGIFKATCQA